MKTMRARSAHLMTSWWVVGVWAALGILTGVISVVTVLQPTWYVRYTLIHAQALQDVTFQVVVSSVGPLGFCRLAAVESHQVIDDSKIRSIFNKEFSSPSNNLEETTTVTDSVESSRFPESTVSSESLPGPLDVTKDYQHEIWKSTEAPTESFHTPRLAEESLQGFPTPGIHYSNLSFDTSSESLPHPELSGKGIAEKSSNGAVEAYESFQISTTTDKSITNGRDDGDGIGEVLFKVTEKYLNVYNAEGEQSADNIPRDVRNSTAVAQGKKEIMTVDIKENSVTEKRIINHFDQEAVDSIKQEFDDGFKSLAANDTGVDEFSFHKHRKEIHTSYKKLKKKKKRKKKRNKKKRKNKHHKPKQNRIKSGDNNGSIVNDVTLHSLPEVNEQESDVNLRFNDDEIVAEFLIQQDKPTAYERNTAAIEYQPRTPIMLCSGVTIGIGSGSSAVWVLVGVVYGVAGVVQVLAGVASILTQAVHSPAGRYAHAIWVGNIQVAVVMSQGVTLVLFPLGLGSPLARVECGGSSSVYWPGDCTFGWAYMLAIVSTTLAAYCPCLARLTVYKRYALREWESLNFF